MKIAPVRLNGGFVCLFMFLLPQMSNEKSKQEIKDVLENKLLWDGQRLAIVDPAVGLAVQGVAIERQEQ